MTNSHRMRESAVMISSTIPSAKYSCSGSPLIFWNGSTAIDGLSGSGREKATAGVTVDEVSLRDVISRDRLSDIFYLLRAKIGEGQGQLCADLIPHHTGDANPARLRESLQSGRDIHGVAEEIVALNDDVADVDADPKPHLLADRSISILLRYSVLYRDSALHGINGAGKVG